MASNLKLRVTTLTKERPLQLTRQSTRSERNHRNAAGGEGRVERGVGDAGGEGCGRCDAGRHLEEDSTSNARVTMAIVESVGGAGAEESKAGT